MKLIAGLMLASLAACSQAAEPADEQPTAAPSASEAEALIARYFSSESNEGGPFAPRDDCGKLAGAYEFRVALADAVLKRDADALVALAAPDIKLDFGGGEGHAELRQRLADPGWTLWQALEGVLPLGCAVGSEGGLTLPWYFAQELGSTDPYMAMIVVGEDVPLLAEARRGSAVAGLLSWEAVTLDPEIGGELNEFARVQTLNGQTGAIAEDRLRGWLDYRLIAEKGADGWKMTVFIAGD